MTALEQYVWLEATGLWKENPATVPREVVVAFGESTLTLRDFSEMPVGHWALAGVRAIGRSDGATIYSMTADGAETLTIRDPDMIAAIATVTRPAPANAEPASRGGSRMIVALFLVLVIAGLSALYGPALIRAQALRMLPPGQAAEFGDRMLITLMAAGGGLCDAPDGHIALGRLAAGLDAGGMTAPRVLPLAGTPVAALPGRTILLDPRIVRDAAASDEVAGWIALGLGRAPVEAMFLAAGSVQTLRYIFTGDLSAETLDRAASAALVPPAVREAEPALTRLTDAGLNPAPFAEALLAEGLEPPAYSAGQVQPPLLGPDEWDALRRICG